MSASAVMPIAVGVPAVLAELRCDEESSESRADLYVPCNAPAVAIVWHAKTNRRTGLVCLACARHTVRKRGARLLMTIDAALIT